MRLLAFFKCFLGDGHKWTNSKKKRGYMTCTNCGLRQRYR
jgi:hypothetical protein